MHEDGDENDLEDWEVEEALVTDNKRRGERDRPEVGTCGPPTAGIQTLSSDRCSPAGFPAGRG